MAPIDIVIDIIKRHMRESEENLKNMNDSFIEGQIDAYKGLIQEFEGFKKIFS